VSVFSVCCCWRVDSLASSACARTHYSVIRYLESTGKKRSESGKKSRSSSEKTEWTAEEQSQFEAALKNIPKKAGEDVNLRWEAIAAACGKTKKECVRRFKSLRDAAAKK
jgi:hypothetical protein